MNDKQFKMIPIAQPDLRGKELAYITDAVKSGWVSSLGKYINLFEGAFAAYCQRRYGIFVSNGTVALHLALLALGIGEGDEVIIPALSFIATANVVAYTGAQPVFVDVNPEYWGIDPGKIKAAITPRTRAIMVVHLYGHPADMDPIMEIARKFNLFVIEDAAEAHGAEYNHRKVGSIGDIGVFSFYGNKIITTGEGGMLVLNNRKIADRIRLLKDHGMDKKRKYRHSLIGYNYRGTNVQAALGLAQLERIELFIEKKRALARLYNSLLCNCDGIILPEEKSWAKNVYWMYSVLIQPLNYGICRNRLIEKLHVRGIDSRPFFYPLPMQVSYRTKKKFAITNQLSCQGINLPSGIQVTPRDIKYICSIIRKISYDSK